MLRGLTLSNFKAFGERQSVPIAPVTLLYGPNSSGKSSVLQALLLLRQSLENVENPDVALTTKGSLVDLGSFRDFAHGHDLAREPAIGLVVELDLMDRAVRRNRGLADALGELGPLSVEPRFRYDQEHRETLLHSIDSRPYRAQASVLARGLPG
jgi:hypothetical protein